MIYFSKKEQSWQLHNICFYYKFHEMKLSNSLSLWKWKVKHVSVRPKDTCKLVHMYIMQNSLATVFSTVVAFHFSKQLWPHVCYRIELLCYSQKKKNKQYVRDKNRTKDCIHKIYDHAYILKMRNLHHFYSHLALVITRLLKEALSTQLQ